MGFFARVAALAAAVAVLVPAGAQAADRGLWKVYDNALSRARYIDLTHRITPDIPVWKGFGPSKFDPANNPETGQPYTYDKTGSRPRTTRSPPTSWARSSTRRPTG